MKRGLDMYNTLEELLTEEVLFVGEYDGSYYIKLKPKECYDNSIWKVDIKTGKVSFMLFTDYFEIIDKVKELDLSTLKA